MTWNLPNILTVLRLLAAPALGVVFLILPRPMADWAALILFIAAALTDYVDGYLARKWGQVTKFGAMLDPIADKAMVIIAFAVLLGLFGLSLLILLPVTLILFREVFVSGLREFLGAAAGTLKVTKLAKWKTTVQMIAISLLFCWGIAEHYLDMWTYGMSPEIVDGILSGAIPDELGLILVDNASWASYHVGLIFLWVAGLLTFVTGWDYFVKALPFLREDA
ncbi:CDP-diacylglycerol--glycerol-3-phosphate 3-phosphatidyltransferase [Rhodophyticola sp. SM2404]